MGHVGIAESTVIQRSNAKRKEKEKAKGVRKEKAKEARREEKESMGDLSITYCKMPRLALTMLRPLVGDSEFCENL